ncbi:MAG: nitroreductase [Cyanobacteria bacterium]|nr:nitroreductase [Cyanobacteriota bacterium]
MASQAFYPQDFVRESAAGPTGAGAGAGATVTIAVEHTPTVGDPLSGWGPLLAAAARAPSGHNTQPWRFVVGPRHVDLWRDRTRSLPQADPGDRELTIACGAALLNLQLAARHGGLGVTTLLWPDGTEPDWVARVGVDACPIDPADAVSQKLHGAIELRQTARHPLVPHHPLPERLYGTLKAAACQFGADLVFINGAAARQFLADQQERALRCQWRDRAFRQELAHWIRPRSAGDGLSGAALLGWGDGLDGGLSGALAALTRWGNLGGGQIRRDRAALLGAPAVALLVTPEDDDEHWLRAGLALERMLLSATAEGVSAQFWNAAVQEPTTRLALATLTTCPDGGTPRIPQILLGLGYPSRPTARSPRRPISAIAHAFEARDPAIAP